MTTATMLLALAAGVLYLRQPPPTCPAAPPSPNPVVAERSSTGPGDSSAPAGARLALPAGMVGVPVRLAEPAAVAVVRPGDRVDLLVVPRAGMASPARATEVVAARALVLDVLGPQSAVDGSTALYLALPPEQAQRTVALPDGTRFAIMVRE
ncbi:RcpC/CpaB family pilus assembly protein [Micromonospora sp. NPDC050417]|uniref:RcpC/CpaB family pilus assembly protein n=1 Tax=Micromonospora sp. NPDC050417 TaxID=3364280 RepID=UPI0037B82CA9